jgi:hypothetical protein
MTLFTVQVYPLSCFSQDIQDPRQGPSQHRSFTAKHTKNIAKDIARLTHRTIAKKLGVAGSLLRWLCVFEPLRLCVENAMSW